VTDSTASLFFFFFCHREESRCIEGLDPAGSKLRADLVADDITASRLCRGRASQGETYDCDDQFDAYFLTSLTEMVSAGPRPHALCKQERSTAVDGSCRYSVNTRRLDAWRGKLILFPSPEGQYVILARRVSIRFLRR